MEVSTEFWVQILIYGVTFGTVFGSIKTKLNYLENKMDKYNNIQERMIIAEQAVKSAHKRLDECVKNSETISEEHW